MLENPIKTVINIVSLKPQQPDFVTRESYGATQSESALQFLVQFLGHGVYKWGHIAIVIQYFSTQTK